MDQDDTKAVTSLLNRRETLNHEEITAIDTFATLHSDHRDYAAMILFQIGGMARTQKGIELYNDVMKETFKSHRLEMSNPFKVSDLTLIDSIKEIVESDRITKVMQDIEQLKLVVDPNHVGDLNGALRHLAFINYLIQKGNVFLDENKEDLVDVSSIDLRDRRVLSKAIQSGNVKLVKSLLKAGIRVYMENLYETCPARMMSRTITFEQHRSRTDSSERQDIFTLLSHYVGPLNEKNDGLIFDHLIFYGYLKEEEILSNRPYRQAVRTP